jgi:hypothetical protein
MRLTFLMVCMIILYNGLPGAARAQDYPWCAATREYSDCSFTTYEQCLATASGIGGCYRNKRTLWSDGAMPSPSSTRRPRGALHAAKQHHHARPMSYSAQPSSMGTMGPITAANYQQYLKNLRDAGLRDHLP